MKCKVISSTMYDLEDDINDWLKTGKYEITNIVESHSELYITIIIFYLEGSEIRKRKLDKISKK